MKIKHPSKPVAIKADSLMGVKIKVKGKFVCYYRNLQELITPHAIKVAEDMGLDPKLCRSFDGKLFGSEIMQWIDANIEPLNEIVSHFAEEQNKVQADRDEKRQNEIRPILKKMEKEAAKLRKKIPADHIEVTTEHTGGEHGNPLKYRYLVDGTEIEWNEVVRQGWAAATHPGALSPFECIQVCSIRRDDLKVLKERKELRNAEAKAEKEARITELSKPVPESAVKAYYACGGDPENFEDDIDHPLFWLVRNWADAIEYQGLKNVG